MRHKVLIGCGVLSSVLYVVADVVASRRYEGYSYRDYTFSELLATGAPTRPPMVALVGVGYNLLVVACAVGVAQTGGDRRAAWRTGAFLAGYAVSGMVGGVLVPTMPRDTEGTFRNTLHIPATLVMSVCILLAMWHGAKLLDRRFRHSTWGTMLVLVAFGVLTSLQGGRLARNEPTPWMGIEERVNIYATMLWIAVFATALMRTERASSAPDAVSPGQGQPLERATAS
jgi:hypothetical protein